MKKVILSMLAVATLTFTSCSDDDKIEDTKKEIVDTVSSFKAIASDLRGNVTDGVLTLDASKEYTLSGALVIREGAKLIIPAGTKIVTSKTAAAQSLYIAVERGAKIDIQGTAEKPVIMTSGQEIPKHSDWGGLVICGDAATNAGKNATSEVAGLKYGGENNADNSGSIKYLSISYTGANNGSTKEFNGVSFFAVGSGTVVENIYTFESGDDAIEFFGGAVNAKNLVMVNSYDDSLDFADGYIGSVENVYIKGITKAGIEGSNNGEDTAITPLTDTTVTNVSIVKGGDDFKASEQAINFKDGGGKQTYTNLFIEGITTIVKVGDKDTAAGDRIAAGDFKINGKSFDTAKNTVAEYVSTEKGAGNGAALPTWADWTK